MFTDNFHKAKNIKGRPRLRKSTTKLSQNAVKINAC